jgi:cellulose synthase/poly-beta-1,6-N-acetylglucosamine synthase-like glycosyltransferase
MFKFKEEKMRKIEKNKNSLTVSVGIPTYNRAHLIGRAIQNVLNQAFKDFEIIIVNDDSTIYGGAVGCLIMK